MEKINTVHVRVDNDREKIWNLCKIAALQKSFEFAGLFSSEDEKEFEGNMREFKMAETYVLIFKKNEKEIYWERTMKPHSRMANDEFETTYEKALEWLSDL